MECLLIYRLEFSFTMILKWALIIVAANFDYQIMISQRQKEGYDNIGCRFFTFLWIDGQNGCNLKV